MTWHNTSALRATASVFGVYAGLLGMDHGYFETLQGNTAPHGIKILAVSPSELPFPFGHEPAMTLIPNFLATGIIAMVVGLSIVVWSAWFVQKKHGGAILFLLTIMLLFVGGGFGPISLLIPASIAAAKIDKPLTWWRSHLSTSVRRLLAKLWVWSFFAAIMYVPLEFILGQIFGVKNDPKLNLTLCYPLLGLFTLTLVAGFADAIERRIAVHPTAW
jgi:hypothetical protein